MRLRHQAARSGGTSMIELIVVLLVLGIVGAVAAPRLTSRTALEERGFQDALQALLRHGRALAVARQREVCVLLDAAQVRLVHASGGLCNPALPAARPGGSEAFVLAVPAGVSLGGVAQVRFNSQGQPVPNADHVVTVGAQALTVSRETGIVVP